MEKELIDLKLIPLDKSWIIRMGILDLANGKDDIEKFLEKENNLGDDLLALQRAVKVWGTDEPVDVGESGTLYRLLKFLSWKQGLNKEFIKHGTLKERNITDDPSIVDWPIEELLRLDNETSQWATASVLTGNMEVVNNAPYKLALTYEAVKYWQERRAEGKTWEPRFDKTIMNQAVAYLQLLSGKEFNFIPEQAEDFCFSFVFGYVTEEEGNRKWPSLRGHESDRILEMQNVLTSAKEGKSINSRDHRAVQAIAMWGRVNKREVNILYPEAVNKSWPQFWDFIQRY